jgi:HD-GYP domain-containing protein (c-di-GMP phosphodiesterase class II)
VLSRHLVPLQSELLETVREALKGSFGQRGWTANCQTDPLRPLFNALGFKRFETLQHSRRVAAFALLIARGLELGTEALSALETGSLQHDIGKVGFPHNVIMKPGKLNDREWEIVRMHPQLRLDLLSSLPGFDAEAEIVYSHHERFDGGGYRRSL